MKNNLRINIIGSLVVMIINGAVYGTSSGS